MTLTLAEELKWRGFVNQTTLENLTLLDARKWTFYHGYDASADSLTIGNLAALMLDKCFIRHGHKAFILAGGATSLIGDPGGKDSERSMQPEEVIHANVAKVRHQMEKLLGKSVTFVNNLDWYRNMNVLDFMRDIGKHFSMTPLVQRDYIAKRMGENGSGISYTEFSYTLLQGYDFLHLHQKHGVNLQLAGSDQWGNSISGVDLVRKVTGKETHIFTLPLVVDKTTGKKFGKSEAGAIWLDPNKTSVYQFYQFWLNTDDNGVIDYLKIFTELDKAAIVKIIDEFEKDKAGRLAQKTLAYEVTRLVHGKERADSAKRVTEILFGGGDYKRLTKQDMEILSSEFKPVLAGSDWPLVATVVEAGLASSLTEAKRFKESGGIYINGNQVVEDKTQLSKIDLIHGYVILRRGKNSMALIKLK